MMKMKMKMKMKKSDGDVTVPMKKLSQDSDVWVKKQEDDPTTQLTRTCLEEDYENVVVCNHVIIMYIHVYIQC